MVNNIGYQLIANIPQQEIKAIKEPRPFLGIKEMSYYLH